MIESKSAKELFEELFTRIITDSIILDLYMNRIISLHYCRGNMAEKIVSEILEKPYLRSIDKIEVVCKIAKDFYGENFSKTLLNKKMTACFQIRNKLAHNLGVQEKWDVVGYHFRENGKIKQKTLNELKKDFYENYLYSRRVCFGLTQELRAVFVATELTKCIITLDKNKSNKFVIIQVTFFDNHSNQASLYRIKSREYESIDDIRIIENAKNRIHSKYPATKNRTFEIVTEQLMIPEPDDGYYDNSEQS